MRPCLRTLGGALLAAGLPAWAESRFPPPDFTETQHQLPPTLVPPAPPDWLAMLDVALLVLGVGLAAWFALRLRSRRALVWLSVGALAWFGFYRQGCICPIGSVQNVALGLADAQYAVPLSVLAVFFLPLAAALFVGRVFCAGVCPHGALQDLLLLKPCKLPAWLEEPLRFLPWLYLGVALLLAAAGGGFLICRYDPFVGIFRLSAPLTMLVMGIVFLLASLFVGRPYCRFLCPYGALLGLASRLAKWPVRVTPDRCTQCRLCEEACPFGALLPADVESPHDDHPAARRRLLLLLVLLPLLAAGGAWLGAQSGPALTRFDARVASLRAAERPGGPPPRAEQLTEIRDLKAHLRLGGAILGGLLGLAIGLKLVRLTVWRQRADYEADRRHCLACGRCFLYCPQEHQRRGLVPAPAPAAPPHPQPPDGPA